MKHKPTNLDKEWDMRESAIIAGANSGAKQNLLIWKVEIIKLLESLQHTKDGQSIIYMNDVMRVLKNY